MISSLELALNELDYCRKKIKDDGLELFTPWVFFLSNGFCEKPEDLNLISNDFKKLLNSQQISMISIGFGDKYDANVLKSFTGRALILSRWDGKKLSNFGNSIMPVIMGSKDLEQLYDECEFI